MIAIVTLVQPLAPEIQHPMRDYRAWVVRNGRPGTGFPGPMSPFTTALLSDAQLTLIGTTWISRHSRRLVRPSITPIAHDYCVNCHGADGKGGPTGRGITGEPAKLTSQVRSGAGGMPHGREELNHFVQAFVRMYRPHASREDTVIFPELHEITNEKQLRDLGDQFEHEEHRRFGKGGFESVVAQVAELEQLLGIADIAQFTPA